jgi:iron complex transport system ATP-binding protein
VLRVGELQVGRRGGFCLRLDDWRVAAGEVHGVLGTNGAGKSTLLRALCGEEITSGSVFFHGRALEDWPALERARHLGVLPQASSLNFAFSAGEVVRLGLTPLSLGWRDAQLELRRVMRLTDCEHLADRPYPQLSGGERQRVHLARVLLQLCQAQQPPLLLLDEPTSAQDLGQQHRLLTLARELATERDYVVVAILHDLNHALRYTDACLLLDRGGVVATGPPAEVIVPQCVERYWGYRPDLARSASGALVLV